MEISAQKEKRRIALFLLLVAVSGIVVGAAAYRVLGQPPQISPLATKVVTNTIIGFITNEVRNIPPEYQAAMRFFTNYFHCDNVSPSESPFGVKEVNVESFVQGCGDMMTPQEVQLMFEQTLRRNGVIVSPAATTTVYIEVDATDGLIMSYTAACVVMENVPVMRGGEIHGVLVRTWEDNVFGGGGRLVMKAPILINVERLGERFANCFLASHLKSQKR